MNLERNTYQTLREMCSRESELFNGYTDQRSKRALVKFMEEKINNQTVMRLDDDGEETDIEIENAQEEEILEVFEDFGEQSEQRMIEVGSRILRDITPPPVGPPSTPPQESIKHRMSTLMIENFPIYEETELVEEMVQKEVYKNMLFKEFFSVIFDRWWDQDENVLQEINYWIDSELNNRDSVDLISEVMVENACESLVEFMWDTLLNEGPECPVCYECKPGMMVETQCKHTICFTCLNETCIARWGPRNWKSKPCPMCRTEITEMKFL